MTRTPAAHDQHGLVGRKRKAAGCDHVPVEVIQIQIQQYFRLARRIDTADCAARRSAPAITACAAADFIRASAFPGPTPRPP